MQLIINQDQDQYQECSICLESDYNLFKTNCNHYFHEQCLRRWCQAEHNTCPMCRSFDPMVNCINSINNYINNNINNEINNYINNNINNEINNYINNEINSNTNNEINNYINNNTNNDINYINNINNYINNNINYINYINNINNTNNERNNIDSNSRRRIFMNRNIAA